MILNEMLKKGFIDKEKIIFYYQKLINLSEGEILFLLKIIKNNLDDNFSLLDATKVSGQTKIQTDKMIATLIQKNILQTSKNKKVSDLQFNLSPLWKQISLFVDQPDELSNVEDKVYWLIDVMNFERNELTTTKLVEYVNEMEWKKIIDVLILLRKNNMQNLPWETFLKILKEKNDKKNTLNVKKILKENWLEN